LSNQIEEEEEEEEENLKFSMTIMFF